LTLFSFIALFHIKNQTAFQEKSVCKTHKLFYACRVTEKQFLSETTLAKLARKFRQQAKKTRAQAARELRVSQTSIFNAEETPSQSLFKIRKRLIETYSPFKVVGPVFLLRSK